ncbi:MAG: hypothetical protein IMZ62_05890, partial [Chloroflexi bacterium]|nr:hypothetical protein [Chloroflexota bacterium]
MTREEFVAARPPVEGYLYHGSPEGDLEFPDTGYGRVLLEGSGFYATDTHGEAVGYAQGRTARGATKQTAKEKGRVNYVEDLSKNKLDMDQPADTGIWGDVAGQLKVDVPTGSLTKSGQPFTNMEAYREVMYALEDAGENGAEAADAVNANLERLGFDATIHTEGKRGTPHKVTVFINPDAARIVKPEEVHRRLNQPTEVTPHGVQKGQETQVAPIPPTAPRKEPTAAVPETPLTPAPPIPRVPREAAVDDTNEAVKEFRSMVRDRGIRPLRGPMTTEDFGGGFPPGLFRRDAKTTWDQWGQEAVEMGLLEPDHTTNEFRDLLVGKNKNVRRYSEEREAAARRRGEVESAPSPYAFPVNEPEMDPGDLLYRNGEWHKVEDLGAEGKRIVDGETINVAARDQVGADRYVKVGEEGYTEALQRFREQEVNRMPVEETDLLGEPVVPQAEPPVPTKRAQGDMWGEAMGAERMKAKPDVPGQGTLAMAGAPPMPTRTGTQEGSVRASAIVEKLSKAFAPIRTGRVSVPRAAGIYKVKPEVIRSRIANQLQVISHEVGHHLQTLLYPESVTKKGKLRPQTLGTENYGELETLAYEGATDKVTEGFAEYVRHWLTDPAQAEKLAPEFHQSFTQVLNQNPEVKGVLLEAQGDIRRWIEQPATARVRSTISIRESGRRRQGVRERVSGWIDRLATKWVDRYRPIQKAVKDIAGGEQPAEQDPY